MEVTRKKPIGENGLFNINEGYKYISVSNATEVLEIINTQLDRIKNGEYNQSKRATYSVKTHDNTFEAVEYHKSKTEKPRFRKEEWICKQCIGQTFPPIGTIIDYQVPLKHQRSGECTGMGKVDLLSQKGNIGYLLELKTADSPEHPLRAIMEIYTYWKQLGGNECNNFLNNSALKDATILKKAIILFDESAIYKKLVEDYGKLQLLMNELGVECFVAKATNDGEEFIEAIIECKL